MAVKISVEIPVKKGKWLHQCVDSVLNQTWTDWKLTLLWDQGDELSRQVLGEIEALGDPRVSVVYQENEQGVADSRRWMSERSEAEFLMALDDDGILDHGAIERFVAHMDERQWCAVARARRGFMDEDGNQLDTPDWIPFEPRHYFLGMTTDLTNASRPYVIRKSVYDKTAGWEGIEDDSVVGEDGDIFTKCEEFGDVELIDDCLYWQSINPQRPGDEMDDEAVAEVARRVADRTIERRQLLLERTSDVQPFTFAKSKLPPPTVADVDFIIPFWESNEEEIAYDYSRPSQFLRGDTFIAKHRATFRQRLKKPLEIMNRVEITCSTFKPTTGTISISCLSESGDVVSSGSQRIDGETLNCSIVPIELERVDEAETFARLEVKFRPERGFEQKLFLHVWFDENEQKTRDNAGNLWMCPYKESLNYCRNRLHACLESLKELAGIPDDSIKLIEKRQSSAANRNEGIAMSSKRYVCFVDDDTEVISPNVVEVLLQRIEELEVDFVGPKLVTDTGMMYCVDPFFNDEGMPNPRGLGESDQNQYDYSSFVSWLPTTFLLVRRSACCSVGGYDENYAGTQHEDVDFCLRARARGFRCAYVGEVAIRHYNCARNNCHSSNLGYFNRRWADHQHLLSNDGCGKVDDLAVDDLAVDQS